MINRELLVSRLPWLQGISFLLAEKGFEGRAWVVAEAVTFKEWKQDGLDVPPTFQLTHEKTQALMDSLWDCGFRPSEGSGSAGALKATQNHLSDMQKLVFEPGRKTDG